LLRQLGRFFLKVQADRTAHHHGRELRGGGAGRGVADHFAAADHGNHVGDGLDLAQLVGNEDNGFAVVAKLAHDRQQFIGLPGSEHSGGLIQDQDFSVPDQGLDDFHALLHADWQVLHNGVGINVEPVLLRDLADA